MICLQRVTVSHFPLFTAGDCVSLPSRLSLALQDGSGEPVGPRPGPGLQSRAAAGRREP